MSSNEFMATDKQIAFIRSLLDGREVEQDAKQQMIERLDARNVTRSRASDWIERLLSKPKVNGRAMTIVTAAFASVPGGRYALQVNDPVNPIHFFTVSTGKGNWEGFRFLERHVSDERLPIKGPARLTILGLIEADPKAASILFGRETEHCGVCGRELTRPESREAGIGPVCAANANW